MSALLIRVVFIYPDLVTGVGEGLWRKDRRRES
jgi:hypothetical protein